MNRLMVLLLVAFIGLGFYSFAQKLDEKTFNSSKPIFQSEFDKYILRYWTHYPKTPLNTSELTKQFELSDKNYLGDSVIKVIDSFMGSLNSTRYSNSRYIVDLNKGMLQVDCSFWVKQVITRVSEPHYNCISQSGTTQSAVLAKDYFNYFKALPKGGTDKKGMWKRVDDIANAKPGDIIVYKYGKGNVNSRTGHVMIIYSEPVRSTDADTTQFCVYISDSASSGHAEDTRNRKGKYSGQFLYNSMPGSSSRPSGVGIGKMWFNTGEKPYFRWNYSDGRKYYYDIVIGRMINDDM